MNHLKQMLAGPVLFLCTIATAAFKPIKLDMPEYTQNPEWYRKQSEQQNQRKRAAQDQQTLLAQKKIGLFIKNNTQTPVDIRVQSSGEEPFTKHLTPGQTETLIKTALNPKSTYKVFAHLFHTVSEPGAMGQRIMTQADAATWSISNPTTPALTLVLRPLVQSAEKPRNTGIVPPHLQVKASGSAPWMPLLPQPAAAFEIVEEK